MNSFVSLGRLHFPVYGLVAGLGLICAMLLSQRTARWARLNPDDVWNLGMFAVLAAFVLSRLELVIENLRPFLAEPLLVLELPSLTMRGMMLAVVATLVYMSRPVRRARYPLLAVLDAMAPCVVLLWAFLNAGEWAEGTREGLPMSAAWAVESSFGRVHPVEIYEALTGLLLCGVVLWVLRQRLRPGETAAWGLILLGLAMYFLDFFRLPYDLYGTSRFNGSQWRGVQLMMLGGLLLAWRTGVGANSGFGQMKETDAV